VTVKILRENFERRDRWLVYCESIDHLREVREAILAARINGLQLMEYHSENSEEHERVIDFLTRVGGVVLAIKCLDEGVNLPIVNKAIILASSTNPREYIQRRGRILRLHPEKSLAKVFDLLIFRSGLDEPTTCSEIDRALVFARSAINLAPALSLEQYSINCSARNSYPDEVEGDNIDEEP
jgi:superfamily II DNA or RNA helicase